MAQHICVECDTPFDGALGRNCDDCGAPMCCDCYDDGNICADCEDEDEDEDAEVDIDEDDDGGIDDEWDLKKTLRMITKC